MLIFETFLGGCDGLCPEVPGNGRTCALHIKTDAKSVAHAWNQFMHAAGPNCREQHSFQYQEVCLHGVLAGFQDDLSLVLIAQDHRPE